MGSRTRDFRFLREVKISFSARLTLSDTDTDTLSADSDTATDSDTGSPPVQNWCNFIATLSAFNVFLWFLFIVPPALGLFIKISIEF